MGLQKPISQYRTHTKDKMVAEHRCAYCGEVIGKGEVYYATPSYSVVCHYGECASGYDREMGYEIGELLPECEEKKG